MIKFGALFLIVLYSTSIAQGQSLKLRELTRDSERRENSSVVDNYRNQFDSGKMSTEGLSYNLRTGIGKSEGESKFSPESFTALRVLILDEVSKYIGGSFGNLNTKQIKKLRKFIDREIADHGLCSWVLDVAAIEPSLKEFGDLSSNDAVGHNVSDYTYLLLRLRENSSDL